MQTILGLNPNDADNAYMQTLSSSRYVDLHNRALRLDYNGFSLMPFRVVSVITNRPVFETNRAYMVSEYLDGEI